MYRYMEEEVVFMRQTVAGWLTKVARVGSTNAIAWRIKKLTGNARLRSCARAARRGTAAPAPWPCLVIVSEWPSHRRLGDSY